MERSAEFVVGHVREVATAVLVLLDVAGSAVELVTVAVLLMFDVEQLATVGILKTKATVDDAPEASVPKEQSTFAPFCVQVAVLVFVTSVMPAGTVSCVITFNAAAGPAFATVRL
jgi:hypothetical protein